MEKKWHLHLATPRKFLDKKCKMPSLFLSAPPPPKRAPSTTLTLRSKSMTAELEELGKGWRGPGRMRGCTGACGAVAGAGSALAQRPLNRGEREHEAPPTLEFPLCPVRGWEPAAAGAQDPPPRRGGAPLQCHLPGEAAWGKDAGCLWRGSPPLRPIYQPPCSPPLQNPLVFIFLCLQQIPCAAGLAGIPTGCPPPIHTHVPVHTRHTLLCHYRAYPRLQMLW